MYLIFGGTQSFASALHGVLQVSLHANRFIPRITEEFKVYAENRKSLRMEYFYREQRKKHDILMDGDKSAGGYWNFDKENRKPFGKQGPKDTGNGPGCNPDNRTGDDACPFTVLYWDALQRHEKRLKDNQRMSLQIKNLQPIPQEERKQIAKHAEQIRRTSR